ncbi:MAG: ABC transporter permease [bacterium]|nr:ABC transporter permease [bacterium]
MAEQTTAGSPHLAGPTPSLVVERVEGGEVRYRFQGTWRIGRDLPPRAQALDALAADPVRGVSFDTNGLGAWDSGFLALVMNIRERCSAKGIDVDSRGLPEGVRRLMAMADAAPEAEARAQEPHTSVLVDIGQATAQWLSEVKLLLVFAGETVTAFGRFLVGKARFRRTDLTSILMASGAQALGVVSLIGFLVGSILAFIGALELSRFGAEIYVVNLVGAGMAREMAPMMTAIIMAGRTGAAFAAQLGTMTVNEEVDALRTLGIRPVEFLVLPRVLGLTLMLPLLTLYAMALGMVGGALVAKVLYGISFVQYAEQLRAVLELTDVAVGIVKGLVFGVLVGFAGCLRGLQSGRSAAAVGAAATSAVVTGIVLIILTDAVFGFILNVLQI